MPRRVLDTNILINHWGDRRRGAPHAEVRDADARQWGHDLIRLQGTNAILTPIHIEYLAGQRSARAVDLARTFLAAFEVVDHGRIIEQDWQNAARIAQRVPPDGSRRQMADCLIRAVCDRLHLDVFTADNRFPD